MALADFDGLVDALTARTPAERITVGVATVGAGRLWDLWMSTLPVPVTPTVPVAPTSATAGTFGQANGLAALGLVGASINLTSPGAWMVIDRLSHQGGLSGTVITPQTTNLPTAPLTRYTSGVGVRACLTIYAQIGSTGTTVTVSYTNQDGTPDQISPAVSIGSTNFRSAGQTLAIPLAVGDTGIRSVESVTLLASTLTAGNFGVTLYKPLAMLVADAQHGTAAVDMVSGGLCGGLPEIEDDAALSLLGFSQGLSASGGGTVVMTEW